MIEIAGRKIGPEYPPYFIADIGANHDGDVFRAIELIKSAAQAGVDAVKFQHFSAAKIVSRRGFRELGKIGHQANWDQDVYEAYEAASVPFDWTPLLHAACEGEGVAFLTTPYDLEIVDAIDPYVSAWKIGSGDITYLELIRHVVSKGKPVLLATGASTQDEVWKALLSGVREEARRNRFVLLQCNTNYTGDPGNLAHSNLSVISGWARSYGCLVGLSDHTFGHSAVCAAVALGACVIEKHFTSDRSRIGPDHAFSMEPEEWREMVDEARLIHSALGDGVKRVEENEKEGAIVQRRALRWATPLVNDEPRAWPKNLSVSREMLVITRPCPEGALEPWRIDEVLGKKLRRNVQPDTLVRLEDFANEH